MTFLPAVGWLLVEERRRRLGGTIDAFSIKTLIEGGGSGGRR